MTKLECSAVNCSYNENRLCKRDHITVGGYEAIKPSETVCESFYPRGTNTMTNLDARGPKKETDIVCNALTCVFNENKKCMAGSIQIGGTKAVSSGETECGTFQCK